MFPHELLNHRKALRDPRAFVEEKRRLEKRGEVYRDLFPPERLEPSHCGIEKTRRLAVAEELELIGRGHTKREGIRTPPGRLRRNSRVGIVRVVSGGDLQHGFGVGSTFRENRNTVEGPAGGNDARSREEAEAGLQADEFVETGGDATRSGRVRAERKAHEIARHRHGGTGRRSARNEGGVERILRHSIGRPHPDETGRELIEVRFPQRNCPRRDQSRDDGGVFVRIVGIVWTGRRRRDPGEVDIVLDSERDAIERQRIGSGLVEAGKNFLKPCVGRQGDPDLRIRGGDPFVKLRHESAGRERSVAVGAPERGERKVGRHGDSVRSEELRTERKARAIRVEEEGKVR